MAKDASTEGEGDEARDSESARWKAGEEGLCVSDGAAVAVSAMFAVCLFLSPLVYFLSSTVTRLPSSLVSRVSSCYPVLSLPTFTLLDVVPGRTTFQCQFGKVNRCGGGRRVVVDSRQCSSLLVSFQAGLSVLPAGLHSVDWHVLIAVCVR